MAAVGRLDHIGLFFTPQSVLRRKERLELAGKCGGQEIASVPQAPIHRRLVHEQAEARAAKHSGRIVEATLQTDRNVGRIGNPSCQVGLIHTANASVACGGTR